VRHDTGTNGSVDKSAATRKGDPPVHSGAWFYLGDESSHEGANRLGDKPDIAAPECVRQVCGDDPPAVVEIVWDLETLCFCHAVYSCSFVPNLVLDIEHKLSMAVGDLAKSLILLARPTGIEPVFPPWKGDVLDR
jgi:hypothetical protein